jgi:hypothetical protein
VVSLSNPYPGWRPRAEAPEARVGELAAERARLWAEVNRLRAERREVEHYEQAVRKMEGSLSWRLTAPLRIGKTIAMRVRRKLEERKHAA